MTLEIQTGPYLVGQMLVAMPGMPDPRFARTVIYLCAHNEDGAMGLVINRDLPEVSFPDLLEQLNINCADPNTAIRVHAGGPVESGRGFVLHSPDYVHDSTLVVDGSMALTATVDILKAIAAGHGPQRRLLALGYSGWGPGQLDDEILKNGWLSVTGDPDIIFGASADAKWEKALAHMGIDCAMLSEDAGHA